MTGASMRLIVAHFGNRPSYLALGIRSMAHNPDVDWLMFTDRPVERARSEGGGTLGGAETG